MSNDVANHLTDPAGRRAVGWRLVVPVKGGPLAKSRLRVPDGVDHPALASALALDTLDAAAEGLGGPSHLVVVTSDPDVGGYAAAAGSRVLADPGSGLNGAVQAGLDDVARSTPTQPVAVLLGDIPALRPDELVRALAAASAHPAAFVADAEGTGTVLLTALLAGTVTPHFGAGSAAAHERGGHVPLDGDLPGLRRDVDDEESLRTALCLGVGTHTARLLAHLIAH